MVTVHQITGDLFMEDIDLAISIPLQHLEYFSFVTLPSSLSKPLLFTITYFLRFLTVDDEALSKHHAVRTYDLLSFSVELTRVDRMRVIERLGFPGYSTGRGGEQLVMSLEVD
ncbi:glutamate receptor 2.5-like [Dorcoceras hygrometricum]|uniref:Glutamate receptor 2.5-like n=1 Tax=Dorcoceras hygrometricum TaxID=472368 RepID=A0A2Z7C0C5_9LAMI|nr:glutamate receptor 2.5-like [Dorcoceras hygrometricum]